MKVLVIGAQPDDTILGCGGVVHRHLDRGDQVLYHSVTRGRADPLNQRLDVLPVKELIDGLISLLTDTQPDVVYTHHLHDMNQDHRRVAEAVLIATRARRCDVYGFEIMSTSLSLSFEPDTWMVLDQADLDWKCQRFVELFPEEVCQPPHPRSVVGLQAQARYRGLQVVAEHAEAFVTLRRILEGANRAD